MTDAPVTSSERSGSGPPRSVERSLDWLNFFLADVRDGLGPYLAIYLLAVQHWSAASIGVVMTIGGLAGLLTQTPAGALIDATRAKRTVIVVAAILVTGCSLILPLVPSFWAVALTQIATGGAGSIFAPAIAAVTLGIVGPKAFTRRTGRNEAYNHAGNGVAALLAGIFSYVFGPIAVFWLMAAMAIASIVATLRVPADAIDHDVARGLDGAGGEQGGDHLSGFRNLLTSQPLLIFTASSFLFHLANGAMLPLVGQKLAMIDKSLATPLVSACIVAAQLVMMPVAMLCGAKADLWGRKGLLLAGFAILPLRGVLYTLSDNVAWLVGVQVLDGIGAGIFGALFPLVVHDLTKGTGRFNVTQGAVSTAFGAGAALSPTIGGLVVASSGYGAAFLVLAAIASLAVLVLAVAMPETAPGRAAGIGRQAERGRDGMISAQTATLGIAALATAGVITRPFGWPEAVWAVAGAAALALLGLMPLDKVVVGIGRGTDVYLFLAGMMLLAEVARQEGLFDWLAAAATRMAKGSTTRLFGLVYIVGVVVTVFLSNDATAVVLTPAVAAAARTARVERQMPYLLICAFVANAASFVLPISNPANLVVYGAAMPPLGTWLAIFALPSLAAILATYGMLRLVYRADLDGTVATDVALPTLTGGAIAAAIGIGATALGLMGASAYGLDLGLPTVIAGVATFLVVAMVGHASPMAMLRDISWGVLPLVAGLFVLVEALELSGAFAPLIALLRDAAGGASLYAGMAVGLATAIGCNIVNNLPAGLIAGTAVQAAQVPGPVHAAALIGIDLGPNLSVTGSLATILWLTALRREGQTIGAWPFLRLGMVVMPPALLLALAAALLVPHP